VSHPATARRLARIIAAETVSTQTRELFPIRGPSVVVTPWTGASDGERAAVQLAIDRAAEDEQ